MNKKMEKAIIEQAGLIWLENENEENTWMCFRKEFSWKAGVSAIAQIAVDSKYWLYINGELVVREGGLKRGPSPKGTYFDELDLSEYLVDGVNHLAVLVWYFGKSGFSHLSSGRGGMMFAMQLLESQIEMEISAEGSLDVSGAAGLGLGGVTSASSMSVGASAGTAVDVCV